MFTSYFCPPCKSIDTKAEPLLKELLATRKVKITFIDVPFHRTAPFYTKYYLYAVKAKPGPENIFNVRRVLFEAAQVKKIEKEDALLAYLQEQKISLKPFNEKLIFPILNTMIKIHDVKATPSCIIKYSTSHSQKFSGEKDIWNGLMALKDQLSKGKK
jgi:thiol:disulfide interchange protein DsbA